MSQTHSILIVDDEPGGFDVIEGILFNEGYEFHYASSGLEALKRLGHATPDVILLDVMLPEMDGLEVCRQIKTSSRWQQIPIIMVTALNSREDLARCLEAGADDFVGKPISAPELRARVRSMLRIKRQYDALQASLKLRADMAHMIVHDLRSPLTSIVLAAEILKRTELFDHQQRNVERISTASQQLQSMVDSLLLLAKLEAGKLVLSQTEVNICELGQEVISTLQPIANQRRVELHSQFPGTCLPIVGDAILIRRILDNLLANAIKFSPMGGQVQLILTHPRANILQIQVIDQGMGVKSELQHTIFEPYEVGTPLDGVVQTGLGLTFCKLAVDAHNGTITVHPNQPTGSIFTVELNCVDPSSQEANIR